MTYVSHALEHLCCNRSSLRRDFILSTKTKRRMLADPWQTLMDLNSEFYRPKFGDPLFIKASIAYETHAIGWVRQRVAAEGVYCVWSGRRHGSENAGGGCGDAEMD